MLKNDVAGMAALDKPIKQAEQTVDAMKIQLGAVMGANVYGKRGNQLLEDDRWNTTQEGKPQFEANDVPKHVVGLDDEDSLTEGKRNYAYGSGPDDYADTGLVRPKINTAYGSEPDFLADTGLKKVDLPSAYRSGYGDNTPYTEYIRMKENAERASQLKDSIKALEWDTWHLNEADLQNKYSDLNISSKEDAIRIGSEWNSELYGLIGSDKYSEFLNESKMPILTMPLRPVLRNDDRWNKGKDVGYGSIVKGGEVIALIPTDSDAYINGVSLVEQTDDIDTKFNLARFLLNQDFTEDAPALQTFLEIGSQVGNALDHTYLTVDIVEANGEKKAVIKYSDSGCNYAKLQEGVNPSEKGVIKLDRRHMDNPEFGYICVVDGKTMLMPLIYPNDRFIYKGKDVTYEMSQPIELPSYILDTVEKMLKENGITLNLPR